jgi:hypothetical protein
VVYCVIIWRNGSWSLIGLAARLFINGGACSLISGGACSLIVVDGAGLLILLWLLLRIVLELIDGGIAVEGWLVSVERRCFL